MSVPSRATICTCGDKQFGQWNGRSGATIANLSLSISLADGPESLSRGEDFPVDAVGQFLLLNGVLLAFGEFGGELLDAV